jgi:hypothetical protein
MKLFCDCVIEVQRKCETDMRTTIRMVLEASITTKTKNIILKGLEKYFSEGRSRMVSWNVF